MYKKVKTCFILGLGVLNPPAPAAFFRGQQISCQQQYNIGIGNSILYNRHSHTIDSFNNKSIKKIPMINVGSYIFHQERAVLLINVKLKVPLHWHDKPVFFEDHFYGVNMS